MIGAAVYQIRAQNSGHLMPFIGRLLHGAFFSLLAKFDTPLADAVHGAGSIKPFTVSPLTFLTPLKVPGAICPGTVALWRIAGLNERILAVMEKITPGEKIATGKICWQVEKFMFSPQENNRAGVIDENDLIAACRQVSTAQRWRQIDLKFISPTTFRFFSQDFPWPLPEYVFGSLADKWNANQDTLPLNSESVRTLAKNIFPQAWEGQSEIVTVAKTNKIAAFRGNFSYDLNYIEPQDRWFFLLLAQYAVFAGVGRLTGQGFGQVVTVYR